MSRMNLSGVESGVRLQVLIVAYGRRGLDKIVSLAHPSLPGLVEYIVSWQFADDDPADIPGELLGRKDFRVIPTPTRGVARNRNLALDAASAPLLLESDDDVSYTSDQLLDVIRTFDNYPEIDFFTFRYFSPDYSINYPEGEFDLADPPKGYYIAGAFEMAFRLSVIRDKGIRFNELFGIGSEFSAGEEDLFLHDVIKAKIPSRHIPLTIVTHIDTTTGMRESLNPSFIRTKGAVLSIIHPLSWPLRMMVHAMREVKEMKLKSYLNYCINWIKGVMHLYRLR